MSTMKLIASKVVAELSFLNLPPLSKQWCNYQSNGLLTPTDWCAPPPNWVKINFDGALCSNYLAGVGMVIRDDHGKVLRLADKRFSHWDAGGVEFEAFRFLEGLFEEGMFDKEGLIIEGDCLNVIKDVQKCWKMKTWRTSERLVSIFDVLLRFRRLLFSHVRRENNMVADCCAHIALRSEVSFYWDIVPIDNRELVGFINADVGLYDPG